MTTDGTDSNVPLCRCPAPNSYLGWPGVGVVPVCKGCLGWRDVPVVPQRDPADAPGLPD